MHFTVCKKCFQNGSYCTTQCKIKGHQGSSKADWSACEETRAPAVPSRGRGWMRMPVLHRELVLIAVWQLREAWRGTYRRSNKQQCVTSPRVFPSCLLHMLSEVFSCSCQYLLLQAALQFHTYTSLLRPTVHFFLFSRQFRR